MSDEPTVKAFRLSVSEPDDRAAPGGSLNLHYLAMAVSAEAAVRKARSKPCIVEVIESGEDAASVAKRLRLANGQVTVL